MDLCLVVESCRKAEIGIHQHPYYMRLHFLYSIALILLRWEAQIHIIWGLGISERLFTPD